LWHSRSVAQRTAFPLLCWPAWLIRDLGLLSLHLWSMPDIEQLPSGLPMAVSAALPGRAWNRWTVRHGLPAVSVPHCQDALSQPRRLSGSLPASGPSGIAAVGGSRGELVMVDQQSLVPTPRGLVPVTTCWMCGIGLSPGQMVADGGSACADVRWYCLDMRGCTELWTSRPARPADLRHGTAGSFEEAEQTANLPRRRPASAGTGAGDRSR
jgi:hypothetical protein